MNPLSALRDRLAWSIRTVLSGSGTRKFAPTPGAPTLLPVGGAAWCVHAEASMMVGGIRALLLQSLHPVAMQAVGEHSDFRADPLGRLRRTVFFLGTTTYCSLQEAEVAIEAVRRVHLNVAGVTPEGRNYRAEDPDLLAWVHATEVDSFLEAFERYRRRSWRSKDLITPNLAEPTAAVPAAGLADRYVAEMATVAERLGVAEPPRSRAELSATIDGYRPVLAATDLSAEAVYFLRAFPLPPAARLAYRVLFRAAVDSLPRWAADMHGLGHGPLRAGPVRPAARAMLRVMGWALRSAPDPDPDPEAGTGNPGPGAGTPAPHGARRTATR